MNPVFSLTAILFLTPIVLYVLSHSLTTWVYTTWYQVFAFSAWTIVIAVKLHRIFQNWLSKRND